MKNFVAFIVIAIFATPVSAENWKDPESRFDTSKNFTTVSTIRWQVTDNVQKTCEAESQRRGLGGFGYSVDACSFWEGSSCIIITARKATLHEIGHEMRHCFQGNYH
jgi:hypothetical protein